MAPKAEKKPAKKVAKKVAGGKGKKGKSKVESFKIYIYKVLKQVRIISSYPSRSCLDRLESHLYQAISTAHIYLDALLHAVTRIQYRACVDIADRWR